jgi:hypothetical protein
MKKLWSRIDAMRLAQALFCLNALIWFLFGAISLARLAARNPEQSMTRWIVAILMFGNAAAMLISAWLIGRNKKAFYIIAVAVLLVNIVLTFTDQVGLSDLITLIVDMILLAILVVKRHPFLPSPASTVDPNA